MMKSKRWLALLSVLILVMAACSAPDATEETTTTAGGQEPATTTTAGGGDTSTTAGAPDGFTCDAPIRVGVLQPLTGAIAASGTDAKDGFELFWANNTLDVAGCTLEFRVEDTGGNPDTALQKVDELVQNYGAQIIVGELLANVTTALAERLEDNPDVIFMAPIGSADDMTQRTPYRNLIRAGGWTSSQTSSSDP